MIAALITRRHAEAAHLLVSLPVPEAPAREAQCWNITDDEARRMDAEHNVRMAEADARRACGEHVQNRLNEIAEGRYLSVVAFVGIGAALTLAAILVYALVTI